MPDTPQRPSRRFPVRPSGTPPPVGPDDVEKQLALRDVMEHAVKVTREVAAAKPMQSWRSRPVMLGAAAVLLVAFCLYAFLAQPDWVFGPDPARIDPARREAYLRYAVYLTSQRVETYRSQTGRLPADLEEAGPSWPGIAYRVVSDSVFELRAAPDSATVIVYRSDQPVRELLGSSLRFVRPRR